MLFLFLLLKPITKLIPGIIFGPLACIIFTISYIAILFGRKIDLESLIIFQKSWVSIGMSSLIFITRVILFSCLSSSFFFCLLFLFLKLGKSLFFFLREFLFFGFLLRRFFSWLFSFMLSSFSDINTILIVDISEEPFHGFMMSVRLTISSYTI